MGKDLQKRHQTHCIMLHCSFASTGNQTSQIKISLHDGLHISVQVYCSADYTFIYFKFCLCVTYLERNYKGPLVINEQHLNKIFLKSRMKNTAPLRLFLSLCHGLIRLPIASNPLLDSAELATVTLLSDDVRFSFILAEKSGISADGAFWFLFRILAKKTARLSNGSVWFGLISDQKFASLSKDSVWFPVIFFKKSSSFSNVTDMFPTFSKKFGGLRKDVLRFPAAFDEIFDCSSEDADRFLVVALKPGSLSKDDVRPLANFAEN